MSDYTEFLKQKIRFSHACGFDVSQDQVNPLLKPHQRDCVIWAVRGALPATFMSLAPDSHYQDVWTDINRMRTLNGDQNRRGLEQHVCPLQLDIVDRLIRRYTNENELVFDPFGGLFTVPYRAIYLNRQGRSVELNSGYYRDGVRYLQAMEQQKSIPDLFAVLDEYAA